MKKGKTIISPFSASTSSDTNNYVIQFNPSSETEIEMVLEKIKSLTDSNIYFIYDSNIRDIDLNLTTKKLIKKYFGDDTGGVDYTKIKILPYTDNIRSRIFLTIDSNAANYFFVSSERETFVSQVTSMLNTFVLEYEVNIFGFSKWSVFNNIDLDEYFNLNLIYYTPFYIDYDSKQMKSFLLNYRKVYKTDIYRMSSSGYNPAVLGYDIFYQAVVSYLKYGEQFRYCLKGDENSLMANYKFTQIKSIGSFERADKRYVNYTRNKKIRIIDK
jgi:hypothetical protein